MSEGVASNTDRASWNKAWMCYAWVLKAGPAGVRHTDIKRSIGRLRNHRQVVDHLKWLRDNYYVRAPHGYYHVTDKPIPRLTEELTAYLDEVVQRPQASLADPASTSEN